MKTFIRILTALVLALIAGIFAYYHGGGISSRVEQSIAAENSATNFDTGLFEMPTLAVLLISLLGIALVLVGSRRFSSVPQFTLAKTWARRASTPPTTGLTQVANEHREFLPAALELLETPPSPVRLASISIICAGFVSLLAWSYLCSIDIHAVAFGKIQPSGRTKVVQSLQPGRVVSVFVQNGSKVAAGDPLVQFDATETSADRDVNARELENMHGEVARRRVAIAFASGSFNGPKDIPFPSDLSEAVQSRERSSLSADLDQLLATRESLKSQLDERLATVSRLKASIEQRERLIELTQERASMRATLNDQGALSRALVIDSLLQVEQQKTVQVGEKGQLAETEIAAQTLERKIVEAQSQFIADQTQKLMEAERKRDRLEQEAIKANLKSTQTKIVSPIAGTVQQLSVTTIGQVIGSGETIMTIVPLDAPIEIEAMIENQNIGFVEAGQTAIVKVDAFPFTRYGTIEGTVVEVSRDAVELQATSPGDAASGGHHAGSGTGSGGSSSQSRTLVFPATIQISRTGIEIDGRANPLIPGMAVTVEIKTGKRRAIDYVLSPIREVQSSAARER